ncbi:MAG: hypothetical protein EA370_13700 [Wenzhouxiangella sp.]|nr:MAG: hypothetical protein EA370_13700 [Wenzhouxiangella sp.]
MNLKAAFLFRLGACVEAADRKAQLEPNSERFAGDSRALRELFWRFSDYPEDHALFLMAR